MRARRHWHGDWARDISDHDRNWDLCISYYGRDPGSLPEPFEGLNHEPAPRKFEATYDLFRADSRLWGYDRIWLRDDDLMTAWGDINRMSHLAEAGAEGAMLHRAYQFTRPPFLEIGAVRR